MTTIRNSQEHIVDKNRLVYYESERVDVNIGRTGVKFGRYVFGVSAVVGLGAATAGGAFGTLMAHLASFYVNGGAAYPAEVQLLAIPCAMIAGAAALVWVLPRQVERWNHLVRVHIVHEYEPKEETEARTGEKVNKLHVIIKSKDGRYAEFDQPEAGSFSRLLRYALNTDPTVLTMRLARDFGWKDKGDVAYRLMVKELKHIGWLSSTEEHNSSPLFTEAGKTEAEAWLRR